MKLYFCLFYLFISGSLCAEEGQIVTITTARQQHDFVVEIASTPKQQERGLMLRKYLRHNHGMLFLYAQPQIARFWMKNTYIPLDLIFIDAQDKIIQIYENAQPLSQKLICSQKPIKAVLELFSGSVARYNIKINQAIKISSNKDKHERATNHY